MGIIGVWTIYYPGPRQKSSAERNYELPSNLSRILSRCLLQSSLLSLHQCHQMAGAADCNGEGYSQITSLVHHSQ